MYSKVKTNLALLVVMLFSFFPGTFQNRAHALSTGNARQSNRVLVGREGDGVTQRYIILMNGWRADQGEAFWFDKTLTIYDALVEHYGFKDEEIYFLFGFGKNDPIVTQPDKVDAMASVTNLLDVFEELRRITDEDDEVIFWYLGHGAGYSGEGIQNPDSYGYLNGFANVDLGDEQDYLESDFKLEALHTDGPYGGHHGMDEWVLYYEALDDENAKVIRYKYVSHFPLTRFNRSGLQRDDDPYIEKWVDYLVIDEDDNGEVALIDLKATGDDGRPYYDPLTGEFDESDWGQPAYFIEGDDLRLDTFAPGLLVDYVIHDMNFDNHLDIDLNYRPGDPLEINGTDLDNAGYFDGLDVNEDGDMEDWISIDEDLTLPTSRLTDDILANFLDMLNVHAITLIINTCFSGGFTWDLSGPGRIIIANTGKEQYGYEDEFSQGFLKAIIPLENGSYPADADGNGRVSMLEAFNYATVQDGLWCNYFDNDNPNNPPDCEVPRYDDNGDRSASFYGELNASEVGEDGFFGASVYFDGD